MKQTDDLEEWFLNPENLKQTDGLNEWQFNAEAQLFSVKFFWLNGVKTYEIEAKRVSKQNELIGWILHLCEKSWCSAEMIQSLIETVSKHNGWNFYGL